MTGETTTVVGVGASAGGLDAFKRLLTAVPKNMTAAWVLVQHLDPTHDSLMAELLSKSTGMSVVEIVASQEIKPGCVYVIPPNTYVSVESGTLRLEKPAAPRGSRMAIDHLFRSLANEYGRQAIGVVLSGTGTDGSQGLRAIKAAGGLAIVQDPDTAAYDGMPRHAIEQGFADLVRRVEDIPATVAGFLDHPYAQEGDGSIIRLTREGEVAEEAADDGGCAAERTTEDGTTGEAGLAQILDVLRDRLGLDLSLYKASTLVRRIERRMGLNHMTDIPAYLDHLRRDDTELKALARDVHINVTDFFRDREAFEALKNHAIPELFERARQGQHDDPTLRAWVPGCATGEEAYSIAISLLDYQSTHAESASVPLQVFATDIDAEAVRIARQGEYPESALQELPHDLRERCFEPMDVPGRYRIKKFVRDIVSFATHDVLGDPPFSRLDLISCRNLLIYLQREAQEDTLGTFHFALRPGGYLLLGSSEALGGGTGMFRVIDKKWRLFQRLEVRSGRERRTPHPFGRSRAAFEGLEAEQVHRRQERRMGEMAALKLVAQHAAPPTVLVNSSYEIIFMRGDLIEILDLPSGMGDMTLIDMVREEPKPRVRAALYRAARGRERVTTTGAITGRDGRERWYEMVVTPCGSKELGDNLLMVTFAIGNPGDTPARPRSSEASVNAELDREVEALRDDLRSTVEELEQANEELRTANEEAMTMNEELQSSNEELETQSEELRSVNEELTTVNAQLREKVDELQEANADIANLLNSARLPALFLDRGFCIRRYTPEAKKLLNVIESDVGRPVSDLAGVCVRDGMLEDAKVVIDGLAPVEKEIQDDAGDWHLRRILPYRTDDDQIAGVVVTFSKVTRLKQLTATVERKREQQASVAQLGLRAIRERDFDNLVHYATQLLADGLGCPLTKVLEFDPEEEQFLLRAGVGWSEGLVGNAVVTGDVGSQAGYTLQHNGTVLVEDLATERRFAAPDLLIDHGVRSGVSVLIQGRDGQPYGVLAAHAREPNVFSRHDADFVQQVANVLSGVFVSQSAETDLRASEERFRMISDNIPQLAWIAEADTGAINWYNRRWYEYTGSGDTESLGDGWKRFHHPDHVDSAAQKFRRSLESGQPHEDTFPLRGADGVYRWFLTRVVPMHDEHGRIRRWFGTNTDITARLEVEAELEESRRKLQAIINNAPALIYAKDGDGKFVLCNNATAAMLNTTPEMVIGKTDDDFAGAAPRAEDYRGNDREVWETGEVIAREEPLEVNGETKVFLSQKFPLHDRFGNLYAVCGISTDITDRKQDEQHLRSVMAELNHRVKNTIASIEAIARLQLQRSSSLAEFRDAFSARLRSMGVAHSLLTRAEWRGATLRDILKSELKHRAPTDTSVTIEGPDITIPPKEALALHMAVHELATNAAKYGALHTPEGRIEVRWTLEETSEQPLVRLQWTESDGPPVEEPTAEGFGTGMIESMVLYELGGEITRTFAPEGFRTTITFPARGAANRLSPAALAARRTQTAATEGQPRILLVEDNATLAQTVRDFLEGLDLDVLGPAATVQQALSLLDAATPAVALLDVDLGGEKVFSVADRLRTEKVPFAFLTGYNAHDLPNAFTNATRFAKPVDLDRVKTWIESTLA
jgi:two-component system CheB/CheR fusion protein